MGCESVATPFFGMTYYSVFAVCRGQSEATELRLPPSIESQCPSPLGRWHLFDFDLADVDYGVVAGRFQDQEALQTRRRAPAQRLCRSERFACHLHARTLPVRA